MAKNAGDDERRRSDGDAIRREESRPRTAGRDARPSRTEARAERAELLRRAQSYLVKRIVDSRSTPHNPLLEVVLVNGRHVLNGRSVNYSFGSLHRVFEE